MDARVDLWRFKVLAAVCFAIVVMASVTDRIVAATQTPSAQAVPTSCAHPPRWKPTEPDLHRIVARHFGWLQRHVGWFQKTAFDAYLDHVKPAYQDWRREARSHPEQANLCNAILFGANLARADLYRANLSSAHLNGAHLSGADLISADLSGADMTGAHLSGAKLFYAHLNNADLSGADLSRADLSRAHLFGADLSRADLRQANLSDAELVYANLTNTRLAYTNLAFSQHSCHTGPLQRS